MTTVAEAASARADLLVEIGCEELPPKSLDALREAFFAEIAGGLEKQGIAFDAAEVVHACCGYRCV